MQRLQVIKTNVHNISYGDALDAVVRLAKDQVPSYVCFVNSHMAVEAYRNATFSRYINDASLALTDGKPVALACRLIHRTRQERIAGMDFMPSIITACDVEGLSIFLFGSTDKVLNAVADRIRTSYPHVKIAGTLSPAFRPFTLAEGRNYVEQINESQANIVLVGLGCPKQEIWMAQHSNQIRSILLGVGGAFSVYAGLARRAPVWMQRLALEWLYRLIQEPGRMWKRYLYTNTLFIILTIKQLLLRNWAKESETEHA